MEQQYMNKEKKDKSSSIFCYNITRHSTIAASDRTVLSRIKKIVMKMKEQLDIAALFQVTIFFIPPSLQLRQKVQRGVTDRKIYYSGNYSIKLQAKSTSLEFKRYMQHSFMTIMGTMNI